MDFECAGTRNATNGTINRELAALSRAYSLGCEINLLAQVPRIKKLKESAARSGFFSDEDYAKVMKHLPTDGLRLACEIMHTYGWRKSEVMGLQRKHVDMAFGTLSLDAGSTKNDDPRIVPLSPALRDSIQQQITKLDKWQERTGRRTPWLFTHTEGRHEGEPIADFVRSWRSACKAAGVPAALRHDFRRTAVRNLLNAGTDESTAMKITGHRTSSVFKRYRIVNLADMQRAVARLGNAPLRELGPAPEDVAQ